MLAVDARPVVTKDSLAAMACIFDAHADGLLYTLVWGLRSSLGLLPVLFTEVEVILLEDCPSLLKTSINIASRLGLLGSGGGLTGFRFASCVWCLDLWFGGGSRGDCTGGALVKDNHTF